MRNNYWDFIRITSSNTLPKCFEKRLYLLISIKLFGTDNIAVVAHQLFNESPFSVFGPIVSIDWRVFREGAFICATQRFGENVPLHHAECPIGRICVAIHCLKDSFIRLWIFTQLFIQAK